MTKQLFIAQIVDQMLLQEIGTEFRFDSRQKLEEAGIRLMEEYVGDPRDNPPIHSVRLFAIDLDDEERVQGFEINRLEDSFHNSAELEQKGKWIPSKSWGIENYIGFPATEIGSLLFEQSDEFSGNRSKKTYIAGIEVGKPLIYKEFWTDA